MRDNFENQLRSQVPLISSHVTESQQYFSGRWVTATFRLTANYRFRGIYLRRNKKRPLMSQQITKCTFNLKTRSKMHRTFVSKQHQQSGSAPGQKQDYCRRYIITINSWTSRSLTTISQQKTCEVSRSDIRPNCYKKKYTLSVAMRLGQLTQFNSKY